MSFRQTAYGFEFTRGTGCGAALYCLLAPLVGVKFWLATWYFTQHPYVGLPFILLGVGLAIWFAHHFSRFGHHYLQARFAQRVLRVGHLQRSIRGDRSIEIPMDRFSGYGLGRKNNDHGACFTLVGATLSDDDELVLVDLLPWTREHKPVIRKMLTALRVAQYPVYSEAATLQTPISAEINWQNPYDAVPGNIPGPCI